MTADAIIEELRALRKEVGILTACLGARMSQQEVADHFKVSRSTIARWAAEHRDFPKRGLGGKYSRAEVVGWEVGNVRVNRTRLGGPG